MPDDASFRAIFDINPLPMLVFERGTRRILAANDAAVDLYGYTRDELLTMTMLDIRPKSEVAAFNAFVTELLETSPSRVSSGVGWHHQSKSGDVFDVEVDGRYLTFNGRPGGLAVIRDTSAQRERERVQERLRRSEADFRTLIERAPSAVFVYRRGEIVYANPAFIALLGYDSADELRARHPLDFVHPDDRDRVRTRIQRTVTQKGAPPATVRWVRRDGRVLFVETEGVLLDWGGEPSN